MENCRPPRTGARYVRAYLLFLKTKNNPAAAAAMALHVLRLIGGEHSMSDGRKTNVWIVRQTGGPSSLGIFFRISLRLGPLERGWSEAPFTGVASLLEHLAEGPAVQTTKLTTTALKKKIPMAKDKITLHMITSSGLKNGQRPRSDPASNLSEPETFFIPFKSTVLPSLVEPENLASIKRIVPGSRKDITASEESFSDFKNRKWL